MSDRHVPAPLRVIVMSLSLLLGTGVARAQPQDSPPFELDWRAPSGCPSAERVRSEITRLIGPDSHPEGTTHVVGEISAQEGGTFGVKLSLDQAGRSGERTLTGASCAEVSRAAALLIALAIEPGAADPEPEPEPPPSPPPPPPPLPPAPPVSPPPPVPAPVSHRHFVLALGPAAELGLLPSMGAGVEGSLGVTVNRLSLEVFGNDYLNQNHDTRAIGTGGTFSLRGVGARACVELAPGTVSFSGCAAGSVNHLSARGYGVVEPGRASTNVGALGVSVRIALALGQHAALRLDAGPNYILGDANFVLAGVDEPQVYEATRFDGAGSLKLAWQF